MIDHEHIYRLTYDERWLDLLDVVHRHADEARTDALVQQAVQTFEDTFFARLNGLDGSDMDDDVAACLEKLVLLHSGHIYRVSDARFEQAVRRLVSWYDAQDDVQAAYRYAQFAPDVAPCRDVIAQHVEHHASLTAIPVGDDPDDVPERFPLHHAQDDRIMVTVSEPLTARDHSIRLFKSALERDFFFAVRDVFQTYAPYPNVALSSLIDFDAIKDRLSVQERAYFFKGTVDCVLFDQHDSYRPVYFFELDSAHHDDPQQHRNDAHKDRILALAGHRLYRIRQRGATASKADFVALLTELMTQNLAASW